VAEDGAEPGEPVRDLAAAPVALSGPQALASEVEVDERVPVRGFRAPGPPRRLDASQERQEGQKRGAAGHLRIVAR
jgi:hypothetical protein